MELIQQEGYNGMNPKGWIQWDGYRGMDTVGWIPWDGYNEQFIHNFFKGWIHVNLNTEVTLPPQYLHFLSK